MSTSILNMLTLSWWLSAGYRKRLLITMSGIVSGVLITVMLLSLSASVQQILRTELGTDKAQLFIRQPSFSIGFIDLRGSLLKDTFLSDKDLTSLRNTPGVAAVYPEAWARIPIQLSGSALGTEIRSDAVLLGIDAKALSPTLQKRFHWQAGAPVPLLAPRALIAAYNSGFASANGLIRITETSVIGLGLRIQAGSNRFGRTSSSQARRLTGKVVGVTSYGGALAGIVPIETIQWLHQELQIESPSGYSGAMIEVAEGNDPDLLQRQIQALGFTVEASNSTLKNLSALLTIIDIWISLTGAIILLSSGLTIAQLYRLLIAERKNDLHTLRYLGATISTLFTCLFLEALTITITAVLTGTLLGIFMAQTCLPMIIDLLYELTGLQFTANELTIHPWTSFIGLGVLLFIFLLTFPFMWRITGRESLLSTTTSD